MKKLTDEEVAAELARKSATQRSNGTTCFSCQSPWRERIRGMVKVKANEDPNLLYREIREILHTKWKYPRSTWALRDHIKRHEPELAAELARSTLPRTRTGRSCISCQSPWRERIRGMLEVKSNENLDLGSMQIYEILRDNYKYPRTVTSLRRHIRQHETELWRATGGGHALE